MNPSDGKIIDALAILRGEIWSIETRLWKVDRDLAAARQEKAVLDEKIGRLVDTRTAYRRALDAMKETVDRVETEGVG